MPGTTFILRIKKYAWCSSCPVLGGAGQKEVQVEKERRQLLCYKDSLFVSHVLAVFGFNSF